VADVVTPAVRSRMMAGIKGKNTKPELLIRKLLFAKGLRFRIHAKNLPGKPDLVFPRHKAVMFTHGCFWHKHDCHLFKWPKSREEFWRKKIIGNCVVDKRNYQALRKEGWRVLTIWECAVKGKERLDPIKLTDRIEKWLLSGNKMMEIIGKKTQKPKRIPIQQDAK
jgi:DNA mismatch endonuclease (patch repair protein)